MPSKRTPANAKTSPTKRGECLLFCDHCHLWVNWLFRPHRWCWTCTDIALPHRTKPLSCLTCPVCREPSKNNYWCDKCLNAVSTSKVVPDERSDEERSDMVEIYRQRAEREEPLFDRDRRTAGYPREGSPPARGKRRIIHPYTVRQVKSHIDPDHEPDNLHIQMLGA